MYLKVKETCFGTTHCRWKFYVTCLQTYSAFLRDVLLKWLILNHILLAKYSVWQTANLTIGKVRPGLILYKALEIGLITKLITK